MLKRKSNCSGEDASELIPTKRSHSDGSDASRSTKDIKAPLNPAHFSSLPPQASTSSQSAAHSSQLAKESLGAGAAAISESEENHIGDTDSTPPLPSDQQSSDHEADSDWLTDDSDDRASESRWVPTATGPMSWVQRQMSEGSDPRAILSQLLPNSAEIPEGVHDVMLWKIIVSLLSEPPRRTKLQTYNTMDDVINLISRSSKILVLTGAGVSVSCGIPDFRSRDGLYARLAVEYPDLPDPQAMFDIDYFKRNPYPFFKFAKEIYPGKFNPSPSHKFIKRIESHGKLLRNYTQNIDTLEQVAGITQVIQCHGSFASATCMTCKHRVTCDDVKAEILNQEIPRCKLCPPEAQMPIIKPDIVFFGESLPEEFHERMAEDKSVCDLLIVIGSSLKVRPVSLIPNSLPANIPQILINREPLAQQTFDIELLGNCDVIVQEIIRRLGWEAVSDPPPPALSEIEINQLKPVIPTVQAADEVKVDNRFTMRVQQHDVTAEQSMCSTTDASSFKLNLRGDYLNPMEGSQLSVIGRLKVNDGASNDISGVTRGSSPQPSAPPNSVSQFVTPSNPPDSDCVMDNSHSQEEHSFTGKLSHAKSDSSDDNILPSATAGPSSSASAANDVKLNISSRLPDNSYLHLETSRYVFAGAELLSDEDCDTDDSFSNASEIDESPNMEDVSEAVMTTSEDNDGPSDCDANVEQPAMQASSSSSNTSEQRRLNREFVSYDEDAIDAFPESSNSSLTIISQGSTKSTTNNTNSRSCSQSRPFSLDDTSSKDA